MTVVMVACDFHRMPYKSINPNKGEGGGTSCPRSSPNGKHNPFCPMPICRQIDIVRRTDLLAGEGLTCHVSCVRMSSASPICNARCRARGILVRQYTMRPTTRMAYNKMAWGGRPLPPHDDQPSEPPSETTITLILTAADDFGRMVCWNWSCDRCTTSTITSNVMVVSDGGSDG